MTDIYAMEQGLPRVPACKRSTITLDFNGRYLTMTGNGQTHVYWGVSGRPVDGGGFDYSLTRQQERREGPIPPGDYWIMPSQLWVNHWYNVAPRAAWGDHRITIHVFPGTHTYDRGGFFIHGGTHPGSAGCINLHAGMETFVRDLEAATSDDPDCYIPLKVRYQQ